MVIVPTSVLATPRTDFGPSSLLRVVELPWLIRENPTLMPILFSIAVRFISNDTIELPLDLRSEVRDWFGKEPSLLNSKLV